MAFGTNKTPCVFCKKAKDEFRERNEVMVFQPLNPVTSGHLLVVPVAHWTDFTEAKWNVASDVWSKAQEVAENMGDVNLITSKGSDATQTVFHWHIHLVPRRPNDGLKLPWTDQVK